MFRGGKGSFVGFPDSCRFGVGWGLIRVVSVGLLQVDGGFVVISPEPEGPLLTQLNVLLNKAPCYTRPLSSRSLHFWVLDTPIPTVRIQRSQLNR